MEDHEVQSTHNPKTHGFIFTKRGILCDLHIKHPVLPLKQTLRAIEPKIQSHFVDDKLSIIRAQIELSPDELARKGLVILPVKPFLSEVSLPLQAQVLKAQHWINWDIQSQYCGACGTPLQAQKNAPEKKCLSCQQDFFPRFSPAVMVLIQKENQLLLARSAHFSPGVYSAIAGFVDLGESAEMAAMREVKEELGIEIEGLEYFGTQSWPFPDSLMIAFKARYKSGSLQIDPLEIEDAQWFGLENPPILPSPASIARKLIDSVLRG